MFDAAQNGEANACGVNVPPASGPPSDGVHWPLFRNQTRLLSAATPVVRFTTSTENNMGFAGSSGVVVNVAPLSVLTASPQSVATWKVRVSGMWEMPAAPGRPLQPAGGQPTGRFHVTPPSVLRQIPLRATVAKSFLAVATTVLGSSDAIATSTAYSVGNPSRCWKLMPPSKLRNKPPV